GRRPVRTAVLLSRRTAGGPADGAGRTGPARLAAGPGRPPRRRAARPGQPARGNHSIRAPGTFRRTAVVLRFEFRARRGFPGQGALGRRTPGLADLPPGAGCPPRQTGSLAGPGPVACPGRCADPRLEPVRRRGRGPDAAGRAAGTGLDRLANAQPCLVRGTGQSTRSGSRFTGFLPATPPNALEYTVNFFQLCLGMRFGTGHTSPEFFP